AGARNGDDVDVRVEPLELLLAAKPIRAFGMVLERDEGRLELPREAGQELVSADPSAVVKRVGRPPGGQHEPWAHGVGQGLRSLARAWIWRSCRHSLDSHE